MNASLLTGKGEITDVELNVSLLNSIIRTHAPFVELESVHVTRLGFNVTSFANINRAPIEILVDEVHAKLVEPLEFEESNFEGYNVAEYVKKAALRGPYGLFDRISDNLTLNAKRVYFTFQPMGKFKTRRLGPWTPPTLSFSLHNLRYVSVDEYREEGTPEQVWRHNGRRRQRQRQRQSETSGEEKGRNLEGVMIYKKLSMRLSVGVKPAALADQTGKKKRGGIWNRGEGKKKEDPFTEAVNKVYPLVKDTPIEVHFSLLKRRRDAALLDVQVDITLNSLELDVVAEAVPHLVHALAGVQFAMVKDRSFVDPLLSQQQSQIIERDRILRQQHGIATGNMEVSLATTSSEGRSDRNQPLNGLSSFQSEGSDGVTQGLIVDMDILAYEKDEDDDDTSTSEVASKMDNHESGSSGMNPGVGTAIVLPSGLVIHQKITLSFSLHQCTMRLCYPPSIGGHLQLTTKGVIAELIWPKITGVSGNRAIVDFTRDFCYKAVILKTSSCSGIGHI